MEKSNTIVKSYSRFRSRKPQIRNLLQFCDGAEKHRSKGDIRYLNSQKFLTTKSGGKERGGKKKGHKNKAFQQLIVTKTQEQITGRM